MPECYNWFEGALEKIGPKMGYGFAGKALALQLEEKKCGKKTLPGPVEITFEAAEDPPGYRDACSFCIPIIKKIVPKGLDAGVPDRLHKGKTIVNPDSYAQLLDIAYQPCVKEIREMADMDKTASALLDTYGRKFPKPSQALKAMGRWMEEKRGRKVPMNNDYVVKARELDAGRLNKLREYSSAVWNEAETLKKAAKPGGIIEVALRPRSPGDVFNIERLDFVEALEEVCAVGRAVAPSGD